MRKLLLGIVATVLALALATPAMAITATYSGVYRFRGATADDGDRNSRIHDGVQYGDFLARPRWVATSEGGKVWVLYELDFDGGNEDFGATVGRPGVGINRFVVDFAIPGTTLRARWGKTDWVDATREVLLGSAGTHRIQGYGAYGKLFGPVSLSLFTTKYREGFTAASDGDIWYGALAWKAAPAVTITPFVLYDHRNGFSSANTTSASLVGTAEYDIWYFGIHGKAKFGIADIEAVGIIQDGELDFSRGVNNAVVGARQDLDVEAWFAFIRVWLTFGKLKVGFYGLWNSGDDDRTDLVTNSRAGSQAGRQPDNKLTRWFGPRQNNTPWVDGPQLMTQLRYHTFDVTNRFGTLDSRCACGNGGDRGNGWQLYEILARFQVTKDLLVEGNISLIRSSAERAPIDANFDGDFLDAGDTTFDSAKDIGTEVDVSVKYNIYPSLWVRLTFAYLWAGDYGKASTINGLQAGARDFDDTWAGYFEIRHTWK